MNKTLAAFTAVVLVACSSSAPDAPTSSAAAAQPSPTVELGDIAGTWAFDLDASDPAVRLREKCDADSGGDKAKSSACYAEIRTHAAHEKIRFTKPENGRSTWTSFGQEGAKEEVWLSLPLDLSLEDGHHFVAKPAGKATGIHAEQLAKANMDVMRLEMVDARTIAMNDPKKGRLVFVKE